MYYRNGKEGEPVLRASGREVQRWQMVANSLERAKRFGDDRAQAVADVAQSALRELAQLMGPKRKKKAKAVGPVDVPPADGKTMSVGS